MKVVAVVPMKLNNKRLPQKNTKSFTNGRPLCTYILDTLCSIEEIDDIYVYCSNEDIRTYLPHNVIFCKRHEKFDLDEAKMNDILFSFHNIVDADIYVMTHTTAPFITKSKIVEGIKAVKTHEYDSAFSVKKMQDFLWKDSKPINYSLDSIPRTQDLAPIYMETSGFYIYRRDVIDKKKRRIGEAPYLVEVGEIESIDIDEKEDFQIADAVFNYFNGIE